MHVLVVVLVVGKVKTDMTGSDPENVEVEEEQVNEQDSSVYRQSIHFFSQLWRDKLDHYGNFPSPRVLQSRTSLLEMLSNPWNTMPQ